MQVVIKSTDNIEEITKKLSNFKSSKEGATLKHFGTLKRGFDGLEYQKKMRDEWIR